MRRAIAAAFALFLLSTLAFAAEPPSHIDRLAHVGKLWGTVRYLHPYLAYKDIDWDAALVAAIPRVREAKTVEEYRAAVQGMLDALGDPATRLMETPAADPAPAARKPEGEPKLFRRLDDGLLVIELAQFVRATGPRALYAALRELGPELEKDGAVILDLRGAEPGIDLYFVGYALEQLSGQLVGRPIQAPAQRYLLHSGYRPQEGSASGGYFSGFITQAAEVFAPPPGRPESRKRVVFLLDETIGVRPIALALQAAGDGRIVFEGSLSEAAAVTTRVVDLGEGTRAVVRVSEIVPFPGWRGVRADVEVPKDAAEKAFEAAVAEARKEWPLPAAAPAVQPLPDAVYRLDKTYADMKEPGLEHRQLAVVRAWNVIHRFYPYLHLIGDWDAVLPEFLARMEEAKTGRDYAITIAEMMARVADGHTFVDGHPELDNLYGNAWPAIRVRWVEDAPVVIQVSDEARQKGIEVGDAILAVDGEDVESRVDRLSRTVTASTRPALLNLIGAGFLLRGPAGPVALKIQKLEGGETREVTLARDPRPAMPRPDKGEVVRILPGNLGYVDLTRLSPAEVDGMFETVKDTRGLIFDMRGYPQGTAWAIAPRINTRNAKYGAQFRRSLVTATSEEEAASGFYFSQPLPELPPGASKYTAPTVMIIDDRAISQSEHSGLFYEMASGTKFVGTATAGANGDVTSFTLPGGIHVGFTGHDVRHADGRQLQRVGLIPDVEAAPTRAGLKAGRDELLEKAVEVLEKEIGKAGASR